jgi:hypothetical protein
MPALVAGIHVLVKASKTWMAGTTSPAMTERSKFDYYFFFHAS